MKSGSNFERLLRAGEFVVCGEMGPPQGADTETIVKKCGYFRNVVDAVNLTDNQTAVARMSSVMSSVFALQGGVEPIMQMTCRDRNRLAQQADILGASAAGVKNILCITGDYMNFGNHPGAKGAFDLDSVQLIHMVAEMNAGRFECGEEMKSPPRMFIGAAANPFGEPFDLRIIRLGKKIRAGAQFIQTQPIFDMVRFEQWMSAVRAEGYHELTYILAGVMPVRSAKALEYMRDNVPGMRIAPEYIDRMKAAADPKEEGVAICVEMMKHLRSMPGVSGVHMMPVGWEAITKRIVKEAGLLPRPVLPAPAAASAPSPAPVPPAQPAAEGGAS